MILTEYENLPNKKHKICYYMFSSILFYFPKIYEFSILCEFFINIADLEFIPMI